MLKWDEKRSTNSIDSQPLNCDMRFWDTRNEKQIATNVKVKRETRRSPRNAKRETGNATDRLTRDTTQQMSKWDEKCITVQLWNTRTEKQIATNAKVKRETRTRNEKRETQHAQQELGTGTKCQSGTRNALRATRNKLQHKTTTIITKQHHRFHGKASAHQTTPCAIALRRRKNPCSRHHLEHVNSFFFFEKPFLFFILKLKLKKERLQNAAQVEHAGL